MIEIASDSFVCELSADTPPAVEVAPGETLRVHCRNACDLLVGPGPVRAEAANPGTGPIAVTGAQPGQALKLDILDIACESPGYISGGWKAGTPPQAVHFAGGEIDFHDVKVPLRPMIGMIGIAPATGSWDTMGSGRYGGNMDTNDIAPGATLYLPVYQPGGRLILGDVHAAMGDGEIGGQGLEVAATVTMRVGVEPRPISDHVVLVRGGRLMVVASAERLEDAVRDAAVEMMRILERAGVADEFNAMKLLGFIGETLFGQHCCPIKTVRVAVPLGPLPALRETLGIGEDAR